jgi:hypothetical protein
MWRPTRREVFYLLIIFIVAYIIRGIPSWFNWGWGNDFGIYYGLSQSLVDDPQLFKPYSGWGDTYHYFPMLYIIMAGLHWLTGLEVDVLLRVVSPIIGSFSVVLFYFVVKRFRAGDYIPFLAGFLLALNPFHAYQTAHAAPLTVGHLFLVISLLFFLIKDDKDKPWATHALYIASIMLIMSHHLTTFVYLLIVIGITLFRGLNSKNRPKNFLTDIIYIVFLSAITFAYWAFIATPVFNSFMSGGLYLSPSFIVVGFYLLLGLMVVFLELKYRRNYKYTPRLFSRKTELILMGTVILISILIAGLFSVTDFGTGFTFLKSGILLLIPTLVIYSVAIVGINRVDFTPYGPEVKGIFYPLFGIFIFSIFTWNKVLLPFRFLEYVAYPICILSALGFIAYLKLPEKIEWKKITAKSKWLVVTFIAIILVSGGTTYAVQRMTSRFEESISSQVNDAVIWLEENAPSNATVASDHRISNVLWQRGFNTTYDYAYNLWFSTSWNNSGCLDELSGHGTMGFEYGRVDYIMIDSVMARDGVQSNINETPRVINGTFYEKFNHQPFHQVFEAGSKEKYQATSWLVGGGGTEAGDVYPYESKLSTPLPDAQNWCRVYEVNWTYIELIEGVE